MSEKIVSHNDLDVYKKAFDEGALLYKTYSGVISTLVGIINHSSSWVLPTGRKGGQ